MIPFERKSLTGLKSLQSELESYFRNLDSVDIGQKLYESLLVIYVSKPPRPPQEQELIDHISSLVIEIASHLLQGISPNRTDLPKLEIITALLSTLGDKAPIELTSHAHQLLRAMASHKEDYRKLSTNGISCAYQRIYEVYASYAYSLDLYGAVFGYSVTPDEVLLIQYFTQGLPYVDVVFPHEIASLSTIGKNRVKPEDGYLTIDFAGYTLAYRRISVNGPYSGTYQAYSGPFRVNGSDVPCPYSRVIETDLE